MKFKIRFPILVNLLILIVVSIALFIMGHNYSWQFFIAYIFLVLSGCGACFSIENFGKKHHRQFPINSVFVVVSYLYWIVTAVISFWIGVISNLPLRLFLFLELLPLGCFVLAIVIFQSISSKFENDDQSAQIRDIEVTKINNHISSIQEKARGLNDTLSKQICSKLSVLKEEFQYSDVSSQFYTIEMLHSIFNELTIIELETDAVLSAHPNEATRLEGLISHLVTTIKNNDEICKVSKR